jgi:pilus assembly protein CpaB
MKVSRIVLLLVALLAGGMAAWLATRGGGEPQVQAPVQVAEEPRAKILVAKTDIGMGQRLAPDNIEWQDWPKNAVRAEYITAEATPDALTSMQGAVARFELFPGEPLQQAKLVRSDQGYLSAVLESGMRGVSISVNADSASGGFIVPNDHVDVILTHNGVAGQTSEVILSNVRVLAINTRLGETGTTGAPDNPDNPKAEIFANSAIATLELTPQQAETVVNAGQLGKLSLALRSIIDFAQSASDGNQLQRNAPIKVIRYGAEANVVAGTTAGGGATITVDPASFSPPSTTALTAADMVPK